MELMITVAIVGILIMVAVPSLKATMQGNQVIAATNDLLSAMHIARSEAIKLNARVTVCESDTGIACTATGDWEDGWIVFVDADGDRDGTGLACAAVGTDCLLRVHDGFDDNQLIVRGLDPGTISAVTFTSRGAPSSAAGVSQSGSFSICSYDNNNDVVHSRAVVLSIAGRVRISDNDARITCPATP